MLIALTGLKQSGKSTVAKHLQSKYNFQRINFKDALLKELKEYFPDLLAAEAKFHACTVDELLEKKPGHIRQLLQNFGTELRRKENPNYWVDKWNRSVGLTVNVVADDCRFLNEARTIRDGGGVIIKIVREGQDSLDNHTSETEMAQILPDFTLYAKEGRPGELLERVDKIIFNML